MRLTINPESERVRSLEMAGQRMIVTFRDEEARGDFLITHSHELPEPFVALGPSQPYTHGTAMFRADGAPALGFMA